MTRQPAEDDRDSGNAPADPAGSDSGRIRLGRHTFRSFTNPVFRLFFGAQMGQMAAMNMQMMARVLLVKHLTESPAMAGLVTVAYMLPMLLLSVFGGIIAERVQKKYVIAIGQVSTAVFALVIAFALMAGYLSKEVPGSWWILVVASVFQGATGGLMMPARQAIMPEIVGGTKELLNAISLSNLGSNALRIVSPAAAGFLIDGLGIDGFGFPAIYLAIAGCYLVATAFALALPRTGTIGRRGSGTFADIVAGFRYVRNEKTLLWLLGFSLLTVVLSMPYIQLMPFIAEDILGKGASGMGWLLSISGVGAIAGSLVLASLPNRKRGLMLLISGVIMGGALVAFAASSSWPLSLAIMVLVGLGQTGRMTLSNTLVQYYVADEYRGRVMSIYTMNFGFAAFGVFAAGMMAESMGVQWAVGGFAGALLVLSALAFFVVPRIRRLD
ncbi:MAG: MFS transporter [Dehalococcoidales bacterium]